MKKIEVLKLFAASMIVILSEQQSFGDIYHYNNVIIGERAQGMGGAYCAVADDASGVYYNPAGLAFAQSNDISGSANALYSRTLTYKDIFEGKNFTEKSEGTFSPFFGAMQKLDKYIKGLVGGFAYYSLDTELTDQNDLVQNAVVSSTTTYNILRRVVNRKAATTVAAMGLGYRISPSLSLGVSLAYTHSEDLTQIYLNLDETTSGVRRKSTTNSRRLLRTYGLEPGLGIQWAPFTKLAFGMTLKQGQFASQQLEQDQHLSVYLASTNQYGDTAQRSKSVNPLGAPPLQARFGTALFASPDLLLTADLSYYGAVKNMESGYRPEFAREAVMNQSIGMEYFLTPSFPFRMGIFTNNDARKTVSVNNGEKINYLGLSTFGAWAQPNSQISLGTVVQKGSGSSKKVSEDKSETVDGFAYTVAFSATHSF
ncbi:MAG: hypothetical protein NT027_18195 [Proteobacteria bacterium]|nr:hypothetical protein [Pseudomonadota bacterium]